MSRDTEELVLGLVADLRPVRRLAPPSWRAACWVAAAAAIIGAAVAWVGLRPDIASRIMLPPEAGWWLASVATGASAAVAAFLVALPDRSPRWALLPLPALAAWLAALGWGCMEDMERMGPERAMAVSTNWGCVGFIAGLGLPLLGTMLWALRHAAPIRPVRVAVLSGLAAAALCSAGDSLHHQVDAALMVLLWHGGPVLAVTAVGGAIGWATHGQ